MICTLLFSTRDFLDLKRLGIKLHQETARSISWSSYMTQVLTTTVQLNMKILKSFFFHCPKYNKISKLPLPWSHTNPTKYKEVFWNFSHFSTFFRKNIHSTLGFSKYHLQILMFLFCIFLIRVFRKRMRFDLYHFLPKN